jgi:hypothetical protein
VLQGTAKQPIFMFIKNNNTINYAPVIPNIPLSPELTHSFFITKYKRGRRIGQADSTQRRTNFLEEDHDF